MKFSDRLATLLCLIMAFFIAYQLTELYFIFNSDITAFVQRDLNRNYDGLEDITTCVNADYSVCNDVIEAVDSRLPQHVKDAILATATIEVVPGEMDDFLNYMSTQPISDIIEEGVEYAGIAGYGYEELTNVYAMNRDYVLFHELGHAYEYAYWNYGASSPAEGLDWKFSFDHEYVTSYGLINIREYYAECFATYFMDPEYLKVAAPVAYELLNNDLGCY